MTALPKRQAGSSIFITLIILILLTVMTVSSGVLNVSNLKVVNNMQSRNEAIAAANWAVEQVVSTDFTLAPQAVSVAVDIDQDSDTDYTVAVAQPQCIGMRIIPSSELAVPADIGCFAGGKVAVGGNSLCADTRWEVSAAVQDASTGAKVTVRQGVSKRMEVNIATSQCS